jgi:squalene-hopene/tetraprenyl-beta-curcumene cyclase
MPASATSAIDQTIARGTERLLGLQSSDGYWWAELEANVTMAAEHLMLEHVLGVADPARWQKIAAYLFSKQLDDGSWPIYFGGPGDLSVTVEAYAALKLAGFPADDARLAKARAFVLDKGGVVRARIFTRVWLAMLGESDWAALPAMPPEAALLPDWSPFNIYEFACWARGTIMGILVVWAYRPVVPVPAGRGVHELYLLPSDRSRVPYARKAGLVSWRNTFLTADRLLHALERRGWKPLRERALAACERWIVDRQEADGSWGGIQPPWVYSLIALKCRGYGNDHPVMRRGINGLLTSFALERDGTWTLQPCLSPVWDTGLAITGLREAGIASDRPELIRAGEWILDNEVRKTGDWCIKVKGVEPGGWAFEFANEWYPDTDDTAEVLIALRLLRLGTRLEAPRWRATRWLEAMQSSNGGWGAFDKDNNRELITRIPFADFGATLDPPTEDVTAHVLEWLLLDGQAPTSAAVQRGLRYLRRTQQPDGSWFGRWGVNYVYGLGAALPALAAAGVAPGSPRMRRAVAWLEGHQNVDGGWGESCLSYEDDAWRGVGESTASQTAWALLALLAAGEVEGTTTSRGIAYLMQSQSSDGQWEEAAFTGTGFPRDFMLNYHLYRNYWPLWALGRYRRLREGTPIHTPGSDPWR